ncbi:transposase [Cuniculiplasma divulgatum]|uniref:transposase n=1 Tax=Cuniculiplasma divulgatum TaxID=1673428 RepID=UPI0024117D5C|nr:transposase [Cuniculiplasma divulgatum]WMT50365.1 MAG: transposase [Thermoplasmatales archaeon]
MYSTNIIERMNKEIRRRIKIIDSLLSGKSDLKIIDLRVVEINERWSQRLMRGVHKCMEEIREMFQKKYPRIYTRMR